MNKEKEIMLMIAQIDEKLDLLIKTLKDMNCDSMEDFMNDYRKEN